jgi:hypothetical protein
MLRNKKIDKRGLRLMLALAAVALAAAAFAPLGLSAGMSRADGESGSSRGGSPQGRGALISYERVARLSRSAVASELKRARLGPGAPALGARSARDGLDAYRVVYRTVLASGRGVAASGLVAFPRRATGTLSLVEYGHGTTATRGDVPSAFGLHGSDGIEGRWTAELFASAGFVAALPDYVGMGVGRTRPEYEVAKSEASASLDLLRAAEAISARRGQRLARGVLVTGFSQGAAGAQALARVLARHADPRLTLRALAPISGPYDLTGAELPGMFDGRVSAAVASYYLGYVLTAWNPLYHLYRQPSDAFRAPYAGRVESLFDGSHADGQIEAELPTDFRRLLTAKFVRDLHHPTGALLHALTANSTCSDWTPRVPVRLYAASGDYTVTQVNAEQCARAIRKRGGHVQMIELGHVSHDVSDFLGLPRVVQWFATLTP